MNQSAVYNIILQNGRFLKIKLNVHESISNNLNIFTGDSGVFTLREFLKRKIDLIFLNLTIFILWENF